MNSKLKLALLGTWAAAVAAGMGVLMVHQNTPTEPVFPTGRGQVEQALAAHTPAQLAEHMEPGAKYSLVLLAHPKCPCTRASLRALKELSAQAGGSLAVRVYFAQPEGALASFAEGDSAELARSIPGARVAIRPAQELGTFFGSTTSGQVVVLDPRGTLSFQGGLTISRGHDGASPGGDSILALVRTGQAPVASTPVFGCAFTNAPVPVVLGAKS